MRMTDKYIIMQYQSIVSSGLIQEKFCENCCLEGETGPDIRKRCAIFKYCEKAVVGEGGWQGEGGTRRGGRNLVKNSLC